MPAPIAAAYLGEKSVEAFLRSVGTLYPAPIKLVGKGDRWTRDALDRAIDVLSRERGAADDAADLL